MFGTIKKVIAKFILGDLLSLQLNSTGDWTHNASSLPVLQQ
jgi:hypothetical protein